MVRTGRGSTVKERDGVTHYSDGEGALVHSTVKAAIDFSLDRQRRSRAAIMPPAGLVVLVVINQDWIVGEI